MFWIYVIIASFIMLIALTVYGYLIPEDKSIDYDWEDHVQQAIELTEE